MTAIAPGVAEPALAAPAPRTDGVWRTMVRSKSGLAGLVLVVLITGMSYLAPLFVDDHNPVDAQNRWQGPSGEHWLGTDHSGKDVLKQVVLGGQTIIYVGFLAAVITLGVAVVLGSLAAYYRGRLDSALLQLTDIVMTVPAVVLLAVVGAFFGLTTPTTLALLLGLITWPVLMRSIRAQVLSLKEREFVEAARLQDLGNMRIIFVEIVPNMAGYILINFIIAVTNAMYALVGLYVLGLAPLAGANWGIMIHQAWTYGAIYLPEGRAFILAPVCAIALFQLGLVMLTRSLEEIFNPRLSKG
ncbi:Oligopeptide transport system permease protein OppC [Streptomyces sp. RB5]|uniref:Oligopeptide transport system permease protein OppC n=1 Tax=Streptomyces smaragdinus TaxID=2585196 RepID=A0A7K0CQZ8_9ACTN|nr:ABC transporter permease [Streptomyces smaragdinus]MQY15831.1 Oligopeptide transport system permease protein OppC [Streptomyces smaragdinus]